MSEEAEGKRGEKEDEFEKESNKNRVSVVINPSDVGNEKSLDNSQLFKIRRGRISRTLFFHIRKQKKFDRREIGSDFGIEKKLTSLECEAAIKPSSGVVKCAFVAPLPGVRT